MANRNFKVKTGLEVGTGVTISAGVVSATTFSGNLSGNVSGDVIGNLTGNVTGNLTGNINSSGISTLNSVVVGGATTALIVNGDTRITGILTIGTSSITLDGSNNQIQIGTGVTLNSSGSGSFSNGLNVSGVSTLSSSGVGTVTVGAGNTTLLVQGDARITGILTIGTGSITIDGNTNFLGLGTATPTGDTNSLSLFSTASDPPGDTSFRVSGPLHKVIFQGLDVGLLSGNYSTGQYGISGGSNSKVVVNNLNIAGVSTFTNGPILVGSGTSTETTSQQLQVTGGAYVSDNLGIGTTNPTVKLHVIGNTIIVGTTTVTSLVESSSIALKENISPIENALDKILQLNPVTYDRKSGSSKNEAGLIAEEVETILPNIVSRDENGNAYGINYTKLSVYLIDAIKTLTKELRDLKNGNS